MKRVMIALAAGLLGGQALAADLPAPPLSRAPATYIPVVPVFSWTGFYIGGNGGYAFGNSTWTVTAPALFAGQTTGSFQTKGWLAGGTIGGNYQMGAFVLGAEADFDWSNLKGNASAATCPTCQTSESWISTGRGRAGVAFDRLLVYATGGAAYGNIKASPAPGFTDTSNKFGWTGGGGVEFAFTPNITAKAEYLYVKLQDGSCTAACAAASAAAGGGPTAATVTLSESLVRGGINFKF